MLQYLPITTPGAIPATGEPSMPTTYSVQRGDTLGKIAKRFYGNASRYPLIVAANVIPNPDRLCAGQSLVIPDLGAASSTFVSAGAASAAPLSVGVGTRVSTLSENRLRDLHPIVAMRGRSMIDLCAHAGLSILVTQGVRTWAEQDGLYAKGRTVAPIGNQYVVTKAKGGQSWHNFGLAFDIVVLDSVGKADWDTRHPGWAKAAKVGKSVGLDWGGDWKSFKDLPHFQYAAGLSLADCRALHAEGGVDAIWHKVH